MGPAPSSSPSRLGASTSAPTPIHDQLRSLRAAGGGVLLISEDLDELLALADRIVVLYAGRIIGELPQRRHATASGC